jgi:hypothetical protein
MSARGRRRSSRLVRSKLVVVLVVVALALVAVPIALAGARIYWYQGNISAGNIKTDFVPHNHTYNQMYWGPGATYPGALFMWTQQYAEEHYYHAFNGNAAYSNPGVYYDYPLCQNRDSTSHFVDHCNTQW